MAIGRLTDDASEKEVGAEELKKPLCILSVDASEFKPFKPGRLTGKKEGSRRSSEVDFSNPDKVESFKNPLQHVGLTDETGGPGMTDSAFSTHSDSDSRRLYR